MTPRAPQDATSSFLEALQAARQARDAGTPRAVPLPGDGELYLDHLLPFLVAYRQPTSHPDPGTARLASSEAAYLLAPGHAEHRKALQTLLGHLVQDTAESFGPFLLIELWAGEPKGAEGRTPSDGPAFRVHAAPRAELNATVEALQRALRLVRLRRVDAEVEVLRSERWSPPRLKPIWRPQDAAAADCRVVGLEVAPIWRDADQALYPMVLSRLRRQISVALRRAAHRFAVTRTRQAPVSYEAYGTSALQRSVLKVDARLAEVSQSYDFLVKVTPTNLESAWKQFRRDRLERAPQFHYHPLPVDPALTKRRLFDVPIERIEDPTLADLFREKQLALDRELTMLLDRGTPRFLHGSMQLYGGVDDDLVQLATQLTEQIPPTEQQADDGPMVDARTFAERARQEVAYYQQQADGFDAQVEVRADLYTDILTSHGTLLIGGQVSVPASAVEPYLQHEIGTHALTYHNGRAQPFQLLVIGLPGYDELQEGLAVLSEYLAGGLSLTRLRWLAGRVLAVKMITEGASFVETFRRLHRTYGFYQERAFSMAARVFRGGGLTKDAVYLRGLEHVLRHLEGNFNMDVLMVGKMAARHIPIVEELHLRRVLGPAPFRPRYLLEYEGQQRLKRVRQGLTVLDIVKEER